MKTIKRKIKHIARMNASIIGLLIVVHCFIACGDSSNEFRYIAIGASDAIGIGATPLNNGYVFLINSKLEKDCSAIAQDVELFNLGIPGVELDEIENVEVPAAIELEPELITIWTGSNDLIGGRSVEDFRNDLRDVLETLSQETVAQLYIGNVPKLHLLPRFQEEPNEDVTQERVSAFNAVIQEEANRAGVILVDLSQIQPTGVLVSEDGFHPRDEGHAIIADLFFMSIQTSLCS